MWMGANRRARAAICRRPFGRHIGVKLAVDSAVEVSLGLGMAKSDTGWSFTAPRYRSGYCRAFSPPPAGLGLIIPAVRPGLFVSVEQRPARADYRAVAPPGQGVLHVLAVGPPAAVARAPGKRAGHTSGGSGSKSRDGCRKSPRRYWRSRSGRTSRRTSAWPNP